MSNSEELRGWESSCDAAVEAGCPLISAINLNLSVKAELKAEGRTEGGGLRGVCTPAAPLWCHSTVKKKDRIFSKLPEANSPLYLADRLRVGWGGEVPRWRKPEQIHSRRNFMTVPSVLLKKKFTAFYTESDGWRRARTLSLSHSAWQPCWWMSPWLTGVIHISASCHTV